MKNILAIFLIVCGGLAFAFAATADLMNIGHPGLGTSQLILGAAGLVALVIGLTIRFRLDWHKKLFAGAAVSAKQLLMIAIWFGLLTGLLEGVALLARNMVLGMVNWNVHLFWMKPVSNLMLFGLLGAILVPVVWRWPKALPIRALTLGFIFLACYATFLQFKEVHYAARMLLSIGVAVQLSLIIAARADGFHIFVRRTLPLFVAAAAFIGTWAIGRDFVSESRAIASLPAAKPGAANVLLISLDTLRAENVSSYGYKRPTTPRMDEFAETGVCFERAISTSPWTLPGHASMVTGFFPHELFAKGSTPLNAKTAFNGNCITLAEVLSEHGYRTGGFVANTNYCARGYGFARGFSHYEDYVPSFEVLINSSNILSEILRKYRAKTGDKTLVGRKHASDVNRSFLNWVERDDQRPFFAFLNYFDVHDPYILPSSFKQRFGSKMPEDAYIRHKRKYSKTEINELLDAYDNCIAYLDDQIGILLDELESRGILDDTVVIITSDHGEQFGEHDLMYHFNSLYPQLLHVPLFISYPGTVPSGRRVTDAVTLREIPQTIVDLLAIDAESSDQNTSFPGRSLARYWKTEATEPTKNEGVVFSEVIIGDKGSSWISPSWPVYKGSMKSLMREGFHYIQYGDGSDELFDFMNDPFEENDLSDSDEHRKILERLKTDLESIQTSK